MEHYFELPVTYSGKTQSFNGRLVTFGYIYRFYIVVNGRELMFEKDEEQQFRILDNEGTMTPQIDRELLEAIARALKSL